MTSTTGQVTRLAGDQCAINQHFFQIISVSLADRRKPVKGVHECLAKT